MDEGQRKIVKRLKLLIRGLLDEAKEISSLGKDNIINSVVQCDILPPINGCGLLGLEESHQFSLPTTVPHNQYSYPFGFGDTFNLVVNSSNHMPDNNLSAELISQIKKMDYLNLSVRFHPTSKECGVSRSHGAKSRSYFPKEDLLILDMRYKNIYNKVKEKASLTK